MQNHEEKFNELERRLQKLEEQIFGQTRITAKSSHAERDSLKLEDLKIPSEVLSTLRERIRRVGYMDLLLILLHFSPHSLTHLDMMGISKELKKPVSYKWLDTEFHRKKYSGLVRSESVPGSKVKAYSLNEPGRRGVEAVLAKLKSVEK